LRLAYNVGLSNACDFHFDYFDGSCSSLDVPRHRHF